MTFYVSLDADELGAPIDATTPDEAVAFAMAGGVLPAGGSVTVRSEVRFRPGSTTEWWFARTTTVTATASPPAMPSAPVAAVAAPQPPQAPTEAGSSKPVAQA